MSGFVSGFEWLIRLAGPVLFVLLVLAALSTLGDAELAHDSSPENLKGPVPWGTGPLNAVALGAGRVVARGERLREQEVHLATQLFEQRVSLFLLFGRAGFGDLVHRDDDVFIAARSAMSPWSASCTIDSHGADARGRELNSARPASVSVN